SARDWRAVNEDNPVPVIGLDRPTLDKDLKNVSDKEFVVIDGSPQATNLALSAIKAADFVLIPVQPSPYDVWATSDLVDLVQQRIEMTDGKLKAAFVVSRAIQNTNIGKEVAAVLQDYNLPVLDARIVQRVSYPNSASVGKTVFETESAKSSAVTEITQLVNEVKTFFDKEVEL
ncbi:ParA family partition ATPase, partial [Psychrobacter sp. TB20-MNA-CIBAN-0197]